MDVYVLNKNLQIVGVIDDYESCIWTTRYYAAGDFELYLPVTDKAINLLCPDYYLVREIDMQPESCKNVMIIENIMIKAEEEKGNYLTVTGRCLKSILTRRIIWNQTNITGNFEQGVCKILNENVISPSIQERRIENFALAERKGFSEKIEIQATGTEIATFLEENCMNYGIGWDIYIKNEKFVFELYKGVDRSYKQTQNPQVLFSPEFDNLLTSDYAFEREKYKNTALVAGEGEGTDRKTQMIGKQSGLYRYETFIDARDVSSNNGEITGEQYNQMLIARGNEKLSEMGNIESFSGEIETGANYILNKDYFLGDLVQIVNEYGIEASPRIIEIIDSKADTGRIVIPTLSTWEVR